MAAKTKMKIDAEAVRRLKDLLLANTNQCVGTHLPHFVHPAPASGKVAAVGANGWDAHYTGTRAYRYAAAYLLGVWDASGAVTGDMTRELREIWHAYHAALGNPCSASSYLRKAYDRGRDAARMRSYYVNEAHGQALIEDAERAPEGSPKAEALFEARKMAFVARQNGWMQDIAYFYLPLLANDEAALADIAQRML